MVQDIWVYKTETQDHVVISTHVFFSEMEKKLLCFFKKCSLLHITHIKNVWEI